LHYEKNREGVSSGDATEGKKQAGPMNGMKNETPPVRVKQDWQSYAEAVVSKKVTIDKFGIQTAGEGDPKLHKESVQYIEIMAKNHVLQKMEILPFHNQESITHNIKEILLSLQKEIANCLLKLELGWGNKRKET
jgi:hypothetical protein